MTEAAGTATDRYSIPGLEQAAQILVDRWGIPHIRAASTRDAFFVQGFNAGRDRLWQLDLWRKRGLGLLAADFGPGFLAQDRAARLFLYRGDMAAEWAAYSHPQSRDITAAFVAGINAWITLALAQPALLAPEFARMGTRPLPWEVDDVVRIRSHALVRNVTSELARGLVADLDTDLLRRSIDPPHTPILPEGIALDSLHPDALEVFKLASAAVSFTPERLAATLDDAWRWSRVDDLGDVIYDPEAEGSNNWAVAPSRTATGRPILASDPHRAYGMPSLRYLVHLTAPGLDVIGAGEPVLPGVSLGHNDKAAFSLTIFPMDQEDLYVYAMQGNRYRYGDGWETLQEVSERIAVKGAEAQDVTLRFTRHGPVVFEDAARQQAYAVRTVWMEPGSSAYFNSLGYLQVDNLPDFERVLDKWAVPSVNQVYADVSGTVAWIAAGKGPVRPNWDGLLPVPGDGRYEWAGFRPVSALPRVANPASGYVASANEMNLPGGYPAVQEKVGFEWAEPSRARRIQDVLSVQDSHTLAQSMALQTDDFSWPAKRVGALLEGLRDESGDADVAAGLALLRGWDSHLGDDSAAAALFEVWWTRALKPALIAHFAPDPVVRKWLVPADNETMLGLLEDPAQHFGEDGQAVRDALLLRTLAQGMKTCGTLLGEDRAAWAWGKLHHGYFAHPLTRGVDPQGAWRDVGPVPKGGSGSTVMSTQYRGSDFRATFGASFRMVLDVGAWDNSVAINCPGQSGDPRSPHYDDLAGLWSSRQYVPLLFSAQAVDAAVTRRIELVPG